MHAQTYPTDSITQGLADIGRLEDQGTLVTITTRKKGVVRGHGIKKVFGDDLVTVLVWSGFKYQALVQKSERKLEALQAEGHLITKLTQALAEAGHPDADIESGAAAHAIQEIRGWLSRASLPPDPQEQFPDEEHDTSWEPLTVNGIRVRGCKVYTGPARPDSPRAPVPGHIYMSGVKLGEKIIEPAANGAWVPRSSPKTIAKDILRSWLPIGLYVQYVLDPKRLTEFRVGKEASASAARAGVQVEPEAVRALFKIA